jgi:hypothetical protein
VVKAIARRQDDVRDAVVRLFIKVSEAREGLLRDAEIRRALGEAHFVASITREVEGGPARSARLTGVSGPGGEALTPVEALQFYWRSKNVPSDRIHRLVAHAEALMRGTGQ